MILVDKKLYLKRNKKKNLIWDKTGFVLVCFILSCATKSLSDPGHVTES